MREYYEDLWEALPGELDPPDLELRMAVLRAELRPGLAVLDLGCGAGDFTAAAAAAGARAIGIDVAEAAVRRAGERHPGLDFRHAQIDGSLPLDDGATQLVFATEVIEHVADTGRWLLEIHRVLASGGRLALTTPNHPRLGLLFHGIDHYAPPLGDHLHLYTARSLRQTLDGAGFAEVDVRATGGPPLLKHLLIATAVRP
jgi:SAM-dependent methyltransferase